MLKQPRSEEDPVDFNAPEKGGDIADYGGLPLKLVWAVFDAMTIVVLASGLYLWMRCRSSTRRGGS